ncbi:MAG TPA: FliH/SctL family protein [Bryobacteraceae bacterium]|nr:FliH/SctL family protein [Bryobacteraceae bacterium]
MSSKIIRGDAARTAQQAPWSTADRAATVAPSVPRRAWPGGEVAARVSELEAELEARVREARQAGMRDGQTAAEQRLTAEVRQAVNTLALGVAELAAIKDRLRREAEQEVVQLAIEIARRVLHREIAADPEALLSLTRVALQRMDAREIHRVRVHSTHSAAIESALRDIGTPQRIEVQADATLEAGGLVFETARGNYDVSPANQLREIERGFVEVVQRRR